MDKKSVFAPHDPVKDLRGFTGLVIPPEALAGIRSSLKESKRPGHYFAPGCCQHPDYITQIPVLFQDGTFDIMRAMNIKRAVDPPVDTIRELRRLLDEHRS